MFRQRQQLRCWAARMLLLWLFGLVAGVANACLAPRAASLGAVAPTHAADAVVRRLASTGQGHTHRQDGHQAAHPEDEVASGASVTQANCADFCDKASVSVAPLKSTLEEVQGHALTYPAPALVPAARTWLPPRMSTPGRDGAREPPVRLVFVRLAL